MRKLKLHPFFYRNKIAFLSLAVIGLSVAFGTAFSSENPSISKLVEGPNGNGNLTTCPSGTKQMLDIQCWKQEGEIKYHLANSDDICCKLPSTTSTTTKCTNGTSKCVGTKVSYCKQRTWQKAEVCPDEPCSKGSCPKKPTPSPTPSPSCEVNLRPDEATMAIGSTKVFTADVTPSNGTVNRVTYTAWSINSDRLSVNPTWNPSPPYKTTATAKNPGSLRIVANVYMSGGGGVVNCSDVSNITIPSPPTTCKDFGGTVCPKLSYMPDNQATSCLYNSWLGEDIGYDSPGRNKVCCRNGCVISQKNNQCNPLKKWILKNPNSDLDGSFYNPDCNNSSLDSRNEMICVKLTGKNQYVCKSARNSNYCKRGNSYYSQGEIINYDNNLGAKCERITVPFDQVNTGYKFTKQICGANGQFTPSYTSRVLDRDTCPSSVKNCRDYDLKEENLKEIEEFKAVGCCDLVNLENISPYTGKPYSTYCSESSSSSTSSGPASTVSVWKSFTNFLNELF